MGSRGRGAVDPSNDVHDMVMTIFGGMSKGERARVQMRVKAAVYDLAKRTDRFLGGRPPHGYCLADAGEHPNPSKAAAGQRLHRLEPDPVTAPVVARIFQMYAVDKLGLRTIAEQLTTEGIPSPAAYDRERNRHRDPTGWSHAAVRAILLNPAYRGMRTWGKQARVERLLDPNDAAAGYRSSMRWNDPSQWVNPENRTHEPIVNDELASLVAARISAPRVSGTRRPRQSAHPYCLRGILYCARCGSRLQGSWRPNRQAGPGRDLYRCEVRRSRALPADLADHPSTLHVREDLVLAHLDPWIASLAECEWLADGQEPDPSDAARRAGLVSELKELDARIKRLLDAIQMGGGSNILLAQLHVREVERQALKARISSLAGRPMLKPGQIEAMVEELGGIADVLHGASPEQRAEVYSSLGLVLTYDDRTKKLHVRADLSRVASRVGGAIAPLRTRILVAPPTCQHRVR